MKKIIVILVTGLMVFGLVGCGEINKQEKTTNEKETIIQDNDKATTNEIDILNPFNITEEILSSDKVLLDGYNCRVQFFSLETCRLMLSSNHNKSENSFSFIGYVYEEETNIPDAIFIDNSVELTNSNIYAVGLIGGKENEEKIIANPAIAKYKYSKTSEETALITKLDNNAIGAVKPEYAKIVNKRIDEFKNMSINK